MHPAVLCHAAGEVVPPSVADSLTRLIAEGTGDGDDEAAGEGADRELRASAVDAYLDLLQDRPKLPPVLLKASAA